MTFELNSNRSESDQQTVSYTGNGGYQSSPDDNCTSIHFIQKNEMCDESFPSTIVECLEQMGL